MHNSTKPEAILKLEESLPFPIKIDEVDYSKEDVYFTGLFGKRSYVVNEKGIVVGVSLSDCSLRTLPDFSALPNLECLFLNNNYIESIEGIEQLKELKVLDLGSNSISFIQGIAHLNLLERLVLTKNRISVVPDLQLLENLKQLLLGENKIEQIASLSNNRQLQMLNLQMNEIRRIENIEGFSRLERLYLSNNYISEIQGLRNNRALVDLDLSYNEISRINGLEDLVNLEKLNLGHNQISKIERLDELKKLKALNLYHNNISEIAGLGKLFRLESLVLGKNRICALKGMKNLKKLKFLSIESNRVVELSGISVLTSLEEVYLSDNHIGSIKDLDCLNNLKRIILANNELSDIEEIQQFLVKNPELISLRIEANPFTADFPFELKKGYNHLNLLRDYFFRRSNIASSKVKLPVKIILIGNHGSGKSTLVDLLCYNILGFKKSTHISEISSLKDVVYYDLGGQDYYHGLYRLFITTDALYLLLWQKATDSKNEQVIDAIGNRTIHFTRDYWTAQLSYQKRLTPTFTYTLWMIQTHADTDLADYNRYEEVSHYFSVSLNPDSQDNKSTPSSIFLKSMVNDFIEKREETPITLYEKRLYDFIKKWDSHDPITLENLLPYYIDVNEISILSGQLELLSKKGMVLYYPWDADLKNVVWLNPQKVITYLHQQILSKTLLIDKKGIVPAVDFDRFLVEEGVVNEIKKLLLVKEIVFHDKVDDNYVIPGYLPLFDENSEDYFLFSSFLHYNLILKFERFIPFGLMSRIICHYGQKPDRKTYRRDALIFTYNEKIRVLIKVDFESLMIKVAIHDFGNKSNQNLKILEQRILSDLLELYWGESLDLYSENDPFQEANNDIVSSIPEDLFISIDQQYFIRFSELENENFDSTIIPGYRLTDDSRRIDSENRSFLNTSDFKHISRNTNLTKMKKIFISYSRKDVGYKNELKKHLNFLKLFSLCDNWSCEEIKIGNWHNQIQKELQDADLVIMMLSIDFFNSRYILEHEVLETLRQIEKNPQKKIFPIIVREFPEFPLRQRNDDHLVDALQQISQYQFATYTQDKNPMDKDRLEEKLASLREFKEKGQLDLALKQIVDKLARDLGLLS